MGHNRCGDRMTYGGNTAAGRANQRRAQRREAQQTCQQQYRVCGNDGFQNQTTQQQSKVCNQASSTTDQAPKADAVGFVEANNDTGSKFEFMTAQEMKDTCISDGKNLHDYVEDGKASAYKIDGNTVIKYKDGPTYINKGTSWSEISGKEAEALNNFESKFEKIDIAKATEMMNNGMQPGTKATEAGVSKKYNNNFYKQGRSLIYVAPSGKVNKFNVDPNKKGNWHVINLDSELQEVAPLPPSIDKETTSGTSFWDQIKTEAASRIEKIQAEQKAKVKFNEMPTVKQLWDSSEPTNSGMKPSEQETIERMMRFEGSTVIGDTPTPRYDEEPTLTTTSSLNARFTENGIQILYTPSQSYDAEPASDDFVKHHKETLKMLNRQFNPTSTPLERLTTNPRVPSSDPFATIPGRSEYKEQIDKQRLVNQAKELGQFFKINVTESGISALAYYNNLDANVYISPEYTMSNQAELASQELTRDIQAYIGLQGTSNSNDHSRIKLPLRVR